MAPWRAASDHDLPMGSRHDRGGRPRHRRARARGGPMKRGATPAGLLLDRIESSPRTRRVVDLARYLSLAAWIEPALLRKARLTFLPRSDAGLEADLWFSPLVQSRSVRSVA